jgi:DNA-binding MarR family transcriptional regulator
MDATMRERQLRTGRAPRVLATGDYRALAAFRAGLRRFLHHSEQAARELGLTPNQHQLLLAIRGHAGEEPPIVGDLADALQVRHHTAVEIIDRMERMGLVSRAVAPHGRRRVHVTLTETGERALDQLTEANWLEFHTLHDAVGELLRQLDPEPPA